MILHVYHQNARKSFLEGSTCIFFYWAHKIESPIEYCWLFWYGLILFRPRTERSAGGILCLDCLSVRLSVYLSVCLSVCNSIPLINKVQYLKFGWSYSNQTWTVTSSKDCSHFLDITCPWGWGGVKMWDLEILPDLNFVAAEGRCVSQTHV